MTELLSALASAPWDLMIPFMVVGLLAQIVDGTLGAAFGMVSHTLLVMLGLPPATASAATHSIESLTAGASGLAHVFQRNVDWPLLARMAIPGMAGGLLGVWLMTTANVSILQPVLLVFMASIGIYLIWRAPRRPQTFRPARFVRSIAVAGGIMDATGGGWGPVVTGSLVAQGMSPRMAVGTANAAEFFVTVTILVALLGSLGAETLSVAALGLLIGGVLGAPISAYLTRRVPSAILTRLIGIVLVTLSGYGVIALVIEPLPGFARF